MIGLFPQKMETDFDWVIWQFDSSASILFGLPAFLHNSRSGIQRVHGTGSGGESSGRPSWRHQPFLRQSPPTLASHHPHRRSPFHRWNSYLTPNCVNNSIPYWNCSSDLDLSICCLCYWNILRTGNSSSLWPKLMTQLLLQLATDWRCGWRRWPIPKWIRNRGCTRPTSLTFRRTKFCWNSSPKEYKLAVPIKCSQR